MRLRFPTIPRVVRTSVAGLFALALPVGAVLNSLAALGPRDLGYCPYEAGPYAGCGTGAPGKPVLTDSTVGCTQAQLDWDAPLDSGASPIRSYEVVVRVGGQIILTKFVTVPTTEAALANLPVGVDLDIRVVAINSQGPGEPSDPVTQTTYCEPSLLEYTGDGSVSSGDPLHVSAQVRSGEGACETPREIDFSFEALPATGHPDAHALGAAPTTSGGSSDDVTIDTTGWRHGTYRLLVSAEETEECPRLFAETALVVRAPSDGQRYPKWFYVRYHANPPAGKTFSGSVPALSAWKRGTIQGLVANPGALAVDGYTFAGWAASPTSNEPIYQVGPLQSSADVYAIWRTPLVLPNTGAPALEGVWAGGLMTVGVLVLILVIARRNPSGRGRPQEASK